jgi:23S rRNA (uracil1939-C5)-methyltransferase
MSAATEQIPPRADARVACDIAKTCGGCALIDRAYGEQLEEKRARTAAALGRYPALSGVAVAPAAASPQIEGYRTRAKLACSRAGGALSIGLYRPGTHDVTDNPQCPVLDETVRAVANAARRVFSRPPFDALGLRHLSIRAVASSQRAHLTLVLSEDSPLADEAAALLRIEAPALVGVTLNVNEGPPLRVFGRTFRHLNGEPSLEEDLRGQTFALGPGAFFQANAPQAEAIVAQIRAYFGRVDGTLVDFYAGVGALSMSVAEKSARLTLVEAYDAAVADARAAAARNGFEAVDVIEGSAGSSSASVIERVGRADFVIVNPPRKGCSPEVLDAIAALSPARAAYVSCDVATLARDLAVLARLGYVARKVLPVDMLPQTDHIEALALLERATAATSVARIRILYEDDAILAVDKPPRVAVHEGTATGATLIDLLAADRGAAARAYRLVHRLDAETSGVLVLAKHKDAARALSRLFEGRDVGKRYVCLARGLAREKGVIHRPLAARPGEPPLEARTKYRVLLRLRGHSLLAVTPETGRLHQIRRHLADLSHPIIGDARYGDRATNRHFSEKYAVSRLLLHAVELSFPHPFRDERVSITAPLPGDFAEVLARLGLARPLDTERWTRGGGDDTSDDAPARVEPAPASREAPRAPPRTREREPRENRTATEPRESRRGARVATRPGKREGGRWVLERPGAESPLRAAPPAGHRRDGKRRK